MKNILITRNKKQSSELSDYLKKNNYNVFIEPLFSVRCLQVNQDFAFLNIDKKKCSLIITSANSIPAILAIKFPKSVKIFAVGKKTAQKLAKKGFNNVEFSKKNSAQSLKELIINSKIEKTAQLIYFHGTIINLDFKIELGYYGFKVYNFLSYKTKENKVFSKNLLKFTKKNNFDEVLIFSKNSLEIFFKLIENHRLSPYFFNSTILCFSKEIYKLAKKYGFQKVKLFNQNKILRNFYD